MSRIRWYGPTLILLATALLVIIAGPRLAQEIAWAKADANIALTRNSLEQNPSLADLSDAFRKVAEVVGPSVVHIQISTTAQTKPQWKGTPEEELFKRFFDPHNRFKFDPRNEDQRPDQDFENDQDLNRYNVPKVIGSGSGWVYDKDGHIITNNHVVKGADTITVRFYDGSESKATIVGTDAKTDIAVIKAQKGPLHPSTLAQEPVEQGNILFAFGSPFGFEFSMSQGVVSAKGRRLGILSEGGYENFIQTDAAINRGNSGGPLTNIYGQVVGMNTAIATRSSGFQGLGFAIPVEMVRNVVEQLIERGRVVRGYLGIYIADLNPKLAKTFGFEGQGVLVEDPIEDGPAEKAGIQRGDIITKINQEDVKTADQLRHTVAAHPPGTELSLEVFRKESYKTIDITIGELPERSAAKHKTENQANKNARGIDKEDWRRLQKLGFRSVVTLDEELAAQFELEFHQGVLVRTVRPGSAAHAAGILSGNIITAVMGIKVESVEELIVELNEYDLANGVRLSITDGNTERFVFLELPEE